MKNILISVGICCVLLILCSGFLNKSDHITLNGICPECSKVYRVLIYNNGWGICMPDSRCVNDLQKINWKLEN